jgi:hypothetical protein
MNKQIEYPIYQLASILACTLVVYKNKLAIILIDYDNIFYFKKCIILVVYITQMITKLIFY